MPDAGDQDWDPFGPENRPLGSDDAIRLIFEEETRTPRRALHIGYEMDEVCTESWLNEATDAELERDLTLSAKEMEILTAAENDELILVDRPTLGNEDPTGEDHQADDDPSGQSTPSPVSARPPSPAENLPAYKLADDGTLLRFTTDRVYVPLGAVPLRATAAEEAGEESGCIGDENDPTQAVNAPMAAATTDVATEAALSEGEPADASARLCTQDALQGSAYVSIHSLSRESDLPDSKRQLHAGDAPVKDTENEDAWQKIRVAARALLDHELTEDDEYELLGIEVQLFSHDKARLVATLREMVKAGIPVQPDPWTLRRAIAAYLQSLSCA